MNQLILLLLLLLLFSTFVPPYHQSICSWIVAFLLLMMIMMITFCCCPRWIGYSFFFIYYVFPWHCYHDSLYLCCCCCYFSLWFPYPYPYPYPYFYYYYYYYYFSILLLLISNQPTMAMVQEVWVVLMDVLAIVLILGVCDKHYHWIESHNGWIDVLYHPPVHSWFISVVVAEKNW